jgi:hypothetical protein
MAAVAATTNEVFILRIEPSQASIAERWHGNSAARRGCVQLVAEA